MQRCQVAALLESLEHLFGEQHALVEALAAMHHAVAHSVDFLEVFDSAYLGVGEQGEDKLHALGVLGYVVHHRLLLAVGQFHLHEGAFDTHTLGTAGGHHLFGVHVIQCILDRTASAVKN